jgi:hypothetical protein
VTFPESKNQATRKGLKSYVCIKRSACCSETGIMHHTAEKSLLTIAPPILGNPTNQRSHLLLFSCAKSFHEKAGACQTFPFIFSFFFWSSSFPKLFPSSQAASVATLPSALFVERLSLGASWVYLIQSVLLPGNRPLLPFLEREVGPGLGRSHLISAVELGSFFLSFLLFTEKFRTRIA